MPNYPGEELTARQRFFLVWTSHVSALLVSLLFKTKQIWLPTVVLFVIQGAAREMTCFDMNCTRPVGEMEG